MPGVMTLLVARIRYPAKRPRGTTNNTTKSTKFWRVRDPTWAEAKHNRLEEDVCDPLSEEDAIFLKEQTAEQELLFEPIEGQQARSSSSMQTQTRS